MGLGWTDVSAPDEPRYLQVAEEMRALETGPGGLVLLHLNGEPYTQKPPLYYGLAALFGAPFGRVDEATARLPSALAGVATVLLTAALGTRLLGPASGLLAAALLLTTLEFSTLARRIQLDVLLALFETLALAVFWAVDRKRLSAGRGALLFHGFLALGVLTKGPVGWLLPVLTVLCYLAWERRPSLPGEVAKHREDREQPSHRPLGEHAEREKAVEEQGATPGGQPLAIHGPEDRQRQRLEQREQDVELDAACEGRELEGGQQQGRGEQPRCRTQQARTEGGCEQDRRDSGEGRGQAGGGLVHPSEGSPEERCQPVVEGRLLGVGLPVEVQQDETPGPGLERPHLLGHLQVARLVGGGDVGPPEAHQQEQPGCEQQGESLGS